MSRNEQEIIRDESGRFAPGQSGNPVGRTPNAERIRQLLEPKREELVNKAAELALAGDTAALKLCMERLAPPVRAQAEPVEIEGLAEAVGLTAKADAILIAVAHGQVSPDVGERLLAALANYAKALELDEMEKRIAALEDSR